MRQSILVEHPTGDATVISPGPSYPADGGQCQLYAPIVQVHYIKLVCVRHPKYAAAILS